MANRPRVTPFASRAARSGLVTFFATALALAAHAVGGGGGPGSGVAVLVAVLVGWAGTAVADRQVGMPGLVIALGAVQAVLHGLMTVLGDTSHGHHHAHHAEVGPGVMAAGHVVAVLLTAFVLTRADLAVSAVANVLARVLPRRPQAVPPLVWLVVPDVRTAARTPALAVWGRAAARRGPPA
ncbi:hypothetical protein [Actinokineospora pegani]|uniref:hypothetical protein n=1 Tax=Actinokineospora pegani TaxID=2654637 RepID=UPI0012EA4727|nr:hypothetical protein [Actinokineospora pegani]